MAFFKFFYRWGPTWFLCFLFTTPSQAQLIISQYYEGDVNDKFLEITNVSAATINDQNSEFYLCVYSNENAGNPDGITPGLVTRILGTIGPGQSLIFKNSLATSPAYAVSAGIGALIGAFNGNDIIIISRTKDQTAWQNRIDVIGNASDWGIDLSFYRKAEIDQPNQFYSPAEWQEITTATVDNALDNTIEQLGFHVYNCVIPSVPSSGISTENITDRSVTLSWENGNGTNHLLVMQPYQPISMNPVNGILYNGNNLFGSGDIFQDGYVLYHGFGNNVEISGLSSSTDYYFSVFEFSCPAPQYLTGTSLQGSFTTLSPITGIWFDNNALFDFGVIALGTDSNPKSNVVYWENLVAGIALSVNSPFSISLDGENWSNEINIPLQADNSLAFYVKFSPDSPEGVIAGDLVVETPGTSAKILSLSGIAFPNAWINEFHYEDIGGDDLEFVEIVLQNANDYVLNNLTVLLLNGADGNIYDQRSLDQLIIGESVAGYSIFYWENVTIQNGAPDGIALAIEGIPIQFLSYEGSFTGGSGPVSGMVSADVLLEESNNTTPEGLSIQLRSPGNTGQTLIHATTVYGDFSWIIEMASPGFFNGESVLPVDLIKFKGLPYTDHAELFWETSREQNNLGFEVQKSFNGTSFYKIGWVQGERFSNEINQYEFKDSAFYASSYYRLKQKDYDGNFEFSHIIQVSHRRFESKQYNIAPNPVNDRLIIFPKNGLESGKMSVKLQSILGKKILDTNGELVKIIDQINQIIKNLQQGIYIIDLKDRNGREKHIFLKK